MSRRRGLPGLDLDAAHPRSGALANLVSLGTNGAARIVVALLVGRVIGQAGLATTTTALSLATLLSLMWAGGAAPAATRYIAYTDGSSAWGERAAVIRTLTRVTLGSSLVFALAAALWWGCTHGRSPLELTVVILLVTGLCGYTYARGVHLGVGRMSRLIRWELPLTLAALATAYLLAVHRPETSSPVVVLSPLALAYCGLTAISLPRTSHAPISTPMTLEALRFSGWAALGTLAASGTLFAGMLVTTAWDTSQRAADYAVALNLISPAALVANALAMGMLPRMAEQHGRGDADGIDTSLQKSTRMMVALMTPLYLLLVAFAPVLILVAWGKDYLTGATLLALMAPGPLLRSFAQPSAASLSARGRVSAPTFAAIAGGLLAMVIWGLTPWLGGATAAAVGYSVGLALTSLDLMRRGGVAPNLLITAVMATGAVLAESFVTQAWIDGRVSTIVLVATGACLVAGATAAAALVARRP